MPVRHITILCVAIAVASLVQSCSNSTEPEIGSGMVDLVFVPDRLDLGEGREATIELENQVACLRSGP